MGCECITCPECNGTGNVWWSFSGKYMGRNRCDDLDEIEPCDCCDGEGITEVCCECQQKYEDEREEFGDY